MKRVKALQAHDGVVKIAVIDQPELFETGVLIETYYTAVSPGTERLLIEGSKQGVRQLGYSAVGKVKEVGDNVTTVQVGDIVARYGAPYVGHMEQLVVPETLVAKCSADVLPKHAAFAKTRYDCYSRDTPRTAAVW